MAGRGSYDKTKKGGTSRTNPLRNAKLAGKVGKSERTSKNGDKAQRDETNSAIKSGKKDAKIQKDIEKSIGKGTTKRGARRNS